MHPDWPARYAELLEHRNTVLKAFMRAYAVVDQLHREDCWEASENYFTLRFGNFVLGLVRIKDG